MDSHPGAGAGAAPEPRYPPEWETDVVLRDGATAHLRPIRPGDAAAIERFHAGQSPESIYLRYFAPMPRLSARDLYRFTHVDHVNRVAFVCTVGDAIVGIGRFDRIDATSAEVAFNVSDAHQGRGLASVLLEHLAAAARSGGINRFVAEVLPQNQRMMSVFHDAGYEVTHAYDDGVVVLHIAIDPTERSQAVMEAREHQAEATSVRALLNPSSIALIGVSRRPETVGHRLLADLVACGFVGVLRVVHPAADQILGIQAHRDLRAIAAGLTRPVDLAVIAVPAPDVLDVVRDCADAGVRGLVVVSAGFAEAGGEGRDRERELVRLARSNGMRVVGPNSWGLVNTDPHVRMNASVVAALPPAGRVGLFCQSGAMSAMVLDVARRRGVGVSTFVSAGNRADVSGNDCMQYWEEDPRTDVIGLYLESVGNARKFTRLARRLSRAKPVIVVRSGTSGFAAPAAGRGANSALRPAMDALLRQTGCIRVENVHQLFDVAQLLLHQPLPAGERVAVVTNSDALGALIADVCGSWRLEVAHPPIALHPQVRAADFAAAVGELAGTERVDAVVAAYVSPLAEPVPEVGRLLGDLARRTGIPLIACFPGIGDGAGVADPRDGRGLPVYELPEEAVRALAAATRYAQWRRRDPGRRVEPPGRDPQAARRLVAELLHGSEHGVRPDQDRVAALLACYRIELWPAIAVGGAQEAVAAADRLGYPVALKSAAAPLRHDIALGGVRLDIADADELRADVEQMQRLLAAHPGGLLVQRMAPPGVACMIRSVEDPLLGPIVSFGLGGDASDLLGDVAHRSPPLTDTDVADLVRSVRAAPRLFGHRRAGPVAVPALEELIARVACLADDLPQVAELTLNPVVVGESGLAVLGAELRLAPAAGRTDAARREL